MLKLIRAMFFDQTTHQTGKIAIQPAVGVD